MHMGEKGRKECLRLSDSPDRFKRRVPKPAGGGTPGLHRESLFNRVLKKAEFGKKKKDKRAERTARTGPSEKKGSNGKKEKEVGCEM